MLERVAQLSAWLANTDIGLLELRTPQGILRLGRQGGDMIELPMEEEEEDEAEPVTVKASSVGLFLRTHPVAAEPFARIGQRVDAGQLIGLLNIGPLLLPVSAPQAGIVDALHVESGIAVGYGAPLIDLHPL
ncbi:acetyl-CoA carboxylase biotin carboxyl carrier protein [Variovorax sp. RB3P1]|jgi:acetyl-CoA carboxylase biotin carboxyl carrier protein|uniref:acetyl-CoA carboxylase biotin carboxyl carrier protein n=1 Tax=Variovorax sp. RB3P1 TaxID=3443732 RepID=UPI003F488DB2